MVLACDCVRKRVVLFGATAGSGGTNRRDVRGYLGVDRRRLGAGSPQV